MAEAYSFRPYAASDREACFRIFDANCPESFAPNERADLSEFLRAPPAGYEVALAGDRVVGAFGVFPEADGPHLRWIMLAPEAKGRGLGRQMIARAQAAVRARGEKRLHLATSHVADAFFAKLGAVEIRRTPDGWGPGMHRVDMVLPVV
jgi:GNAT superfamily N-acetyltransferase